MGRPRGDLAHPKHRLAQAEADIAQVARLVAEGKQVTDPELLRRIRQRSDALRREMLRTQGLTDIAVDLVRESRDEG